MQRYADFIVKYRNRVLAAMVILCAVCGLLALRVPINADMTRYLPGDSRMKQGLDLMNEEFADLAMPSTIRVMIPYVDEKTVSEVQSFLEDLDNVSGVMRTGQDEQAGKTLFTVTTSYGYRTPEEFAIEHAARESLAEYGAIVRNDDAAGMEIPVFVYGLAVVVLLGVLFALCASWVEPFLFLAAIGMAIVLNMGTDLVLGSISQTTYSMSAILQLVLSMDYSVILMNRYRQEKDMRRALQLAFPSIASSGFTTLVGLMMLVFMHFKIGRDLGLVLAKGVFLSMACVLTVLPALILLFDRQIERTAKKTLHIRTRALAAFSCRARYFLLAAFILLFGTTWYLKGKAGVSYSLVADDPIAEVFPNENPVVLLFANEDEPAADELASELEERDGVNSIYAYVSMLGRQMDPDEMAVFLETMSDSAGAFTGMLPDAMREELGITGKSFEDLEAMMPDKAALRLLYGAYALTGGNKGTMSVEELFGFVMQNLDNPLLAGLLPADRREQVRRMGGLIDYVSGLLKGETHSLMMIRTAYPVEAPETENFVRELDAYCREHFAGDYYLIGNSVMNVEMKDGFADELLLITLLTACAIFIVVALTFRQAVVPLILVLVVQCGVFLTITTTSLLGYDMYYLAIIIVQCILMGATVDYGILFTNYYREMRAGGLAINEALRETYERSMHTILTSSLFMIFGTGAIGFSPADPTITQICKSISLGAVSALLLVVFVLPGILAALDRFTAPRR